MKIRPFIFICHSISPFLLVAISSSPIHIFLWSALVNNSFYSTSMASHVCSHENLYCLLFIFFNIFVQVNFIYCLLLLLSLRPSSTRAHDTGEEFIIQGRKNMKYLHLISPCLKCFVWLIFVCLVDFFETSLSLVWPSTSDFPASTAQVLSFKACILEGSVYFSVSVRQCRSIFP